MNYLALFKSRRKLYGLSYLLFPQSRIVKGNNPLKETRAPIATSRGFSAELGNIRALLENPWKLRLPHPHYKVDFGL